MDLNVVRDAFIDELGKIAADLTEAARDEIAPKNFALTPKQSDTGEPAYPIEDKAHAANALARVKQHGTPAQKSEVYKDVAKKYPGLAAKSSVPQVHAKAKESQFAAPGITTGTMGTGTLPVAHAAPQVAGSIGQGGVSANKLGSAGLGTLASPRLSKTAGKGTFWEGAQGEIGPATGATLGAGLASMTGVNPLGGAALGYGVGSLPEMLIKHLKKKGKL